VEPPQIHRDLARVAAERLRLPEARCTVKVALRRAATTVAETLPGMPFPKDPRPIPFVVAVVVAAEAEQGRWWTVATQHRPVAAVGELRTCRQDTAKLREAMPDEELGRLSMMPQQAPT